jgi:hypothetical protein
MFVSCSLYPGGSAETQVAVQKYLQVELYPLHETFAYKKYEEGL